MPLFFSGLTETPQRVEPGFAWSRSPPPDEYACLAASCPTRCQNNSWYHYGWSAYVVSPCNPRATI